MDGFLAELHLCLYLYVHAYQYERLCWYLFLYLGCRRRIDPGWPGSDRVAYVFVFVFVFEVQREDSSPGWTGSGRVASVHSLSSTSHMDICTTGAHWQALVESGAEEDALASVQAV